MGEVLEIGHRLAAEKIRVFVLDSDSTRGPGKCEEAVPNAAAATFLGQFCPLDHPQRRDWGAACMLHTKFLGCLNS